MSSSAIVEPTLPNASSTDPAATESDLRAPGFFANQHLILNELRCTLEKVSEAETNTAIHAILNAPRIFVTGAGRSGLALKMAAMRLMHLGLTVHVAGEITTPAITAGDLLIAASGSGTTPGVVLSAVTANKAGAEVLAITTAPESPLGTVATHLLVIPAATKQDDSATKSQQYAGALFEQSVLLLTDALFQSMWHQLGESAAKLWKRHANLE
jgi:6-phospho-3-hexuloisomerase